MITFEQMKSSPKSNFPEFIGLHHSAASADQTFESIQNYHLSLGWENYGYHWHISKLGEVRAGRPEHYYGAHIKNQNTKSIGILMVGNFDIDIPTKAQENALKELVASIRGRYGDLPVKYHRDFSTKSCPGANISDEWANNLLTPTLNKEEIKNQIIELLAKL